MSVRKLCVALGTTAVVVSGLASAAMAPANADPAATPGLTDYVGVGSDTTQFVVTDLINGATVNGTAVPGYNSTTGATDPKMASFDACTVPAGKLYPCTASTSTTPQMITLRTGSTPIVRPNGSGAGKALIYGATDNPDVTFARSSSGLNATEVGAGLKAYPFAVDTLVTVTAPVTNAPATLTPQQILGIYNGSITNWSDVGGKSGAINVLQPQSSSGTLSFFKTQLTNINGGTAPTDIAKDHELADTTTGAPCATASTTCVDTLVQEHDPTLLTNDPNAIAPFSLGRANLAGPSAVTVVKGFSARRALYNVLRSQSASGTTDNPAWFGGTPAMNAIFGTTGFICSAAARPLIEAEGFKQLVSSADGGSCGSTITSTSAPDLSVYDADGVASNVSGTVTGATYGAVHKLTVHVTGAGATPTGSVKVNLGTVNLTGALTNGTAVINVPATLPAGTYDAATTYLGDSNFTTSSADIALVVKKATTKVTAKFPTTAKPSAKKIKGKVTVASAGSVVPTGKVSVLAGKKVVGSGTLKKGVATISITTSKLAKGKNTLTVSYPGTSNFGLSKATIKVTKQVKKK